MHLQYLAVVCIHLPKMMEVILYVCTVFQIPSRDADIPLLALSTCSSSSGNFKMTLWFSSHFSARKWRSVVFWPMDLVSRSWKEKTKKHTMKYSIKRKKNNVSIQSFHQSFTFQMYHTAKLAEVHMPGYVPTLCYTMCPVYIYTACQNKVLKKS